MLTSYSHDPLLHSRKYHNVTQSLYMTNFWSLPLPSQWPGVDCEGTDLLENEEPNRIITWIESFIIQAYSGNTHQKKEWKHTHTHTHAHTCTHKHIHAHTHTHMEIHSVCFDKTRIIYICVCNWLVKIRKLSIIDYKNFTFSSKIYCIMQVYTY